jgi:hypothetical protein
MIRPNRILAPSGAASEITPLLPGFDLIAGSEKSAGATMYCPPHPAAPRIAPAARLREFCLHDSAQQDLPWLI